jgi:hypothetical protein
MLDHLQHVRLVWIPLAMGIVGAAVILWREMRRP